LVAQRIPTAVEEAEVVAIAAKGRSRGGQASSKSNEVGKHDEAFENDRNAVRRVVEKKESSLKLCQKGVYVGKT
jgi:hypothetical protein